MREPKPSQPAMAADAYRQCGQTVYALLDEIRGKLDAHAQRAAADPRNWGFPGELGHVEEVLRGLAAFMR